MSATAYGIVENAAVFRGMVAKELSHISVLLRSNSGAVALSNVSYCIRISENRILEGKTDKDGLICHKNIPAGDYLLELNGVKTDVYVPTLPRSIERCAIRVPGNFLFSENQEV